MLLCNSRYHAGDVQRLTFTEEKKLQFTEAQAHQLNMIGLMMLVLCIGTPIVCGLMVWASNWYHFRHKISAKK